MLCDVVMFHTPFLFLKKLFSPIAGSFDFYPYDINLCITTGGPPHESKLFAIHYLLAHFCEININNFCCLWGSKIVSCLKGITQLLSA